MEKGNLEVLLFTVQSRMRANNQKVYVPREGKLISDINKVGRGPWRRGAVPYRTGADGESCRQAWERLEKAEHERELALRTELIRQEKLEQLAARFDRKAAMRETWLSENQRLVSQVPVGGGDCVDGGPAPHCYTHLMTPGTRVAGRPAAHCHRPRGPKVFRGPAPHCHRPPGPEVSGGPAPHCH